MRNFYIKQFVSIICLGLISLCSVNQAVAQCSVTISPSSQAICAGKSATLTANFTVSNTRTYLIPLAQLTNQGSACDASAIHRYNGCTGTPVGFTWTDAGSGTVTNVQFEIAVGIDCQAASHTSTLNGTTLAATFNTPGTNCICEAAPGVQVYSINAPTPAVYNVGGTNSYTVTGPSCFGMSPSAALSGAYARVTVTYTGATGSPTYLWNTGATTSSITVSPASTSTYTVTVTGGSCQANNSASVTVNPLPTVTSSTPNSRCGAGSVNLSANAGSGQTIDWYANPTGGSSLASGSTNFATPSISAATTYYAEARNTTTGCVSSARTAVTATINPLPTPSVFAASTSFCAGGSTTLNATAFGNAITLNGSNYSVSTNAALPLGNATRTIEAWIKTTMTGNGVIANWGQIVTNQRSGLLVIGGKLYFVGENNDLQGAITINDGNWHHVAATFDGATVRLYVDGTLDVSANKTLNTTGTTLRIGQRSIGDSGSELFAGSIDELRIWNTVRTQSDLQTYRYAEIPGSSSGLVAYYKFNEASGLSLADASNNNVTSTLTAAATRTASTLGNYSTYSWTPGGATTSSITANAAGNYIVTVTDAKGCSSTSGAITITANTPPSLTVSATSAAICAGLSTTLTATTSGNVTWSPATGLNTTSGTTVIATPSATTTYTATSTDATSGCTSTATQTITVNSIPAISGITGNLAICYGNTTTLTAASSDPSPVFKWYSAATGGTLYYTGASYTTGALTTTGTYYVDVTNAGGCVSAARTPVTVTTSAFPEANAKAVNPTTFCAGGNVGLSAATYALQLNGSNTVSVANGYAATDDITYEATVKASSFAFGDFNVIVNHDNYNTGAIHFQFTNGTLQFSVAGNAPNDQYASYTFNTNTTYKVAAVYSKSGKYVKFYVNGVFVNQANYSSTVSIIGNNPYYIGSWNGNSRYFQGTIDNIRIWNLQRSASDILDAYNNVPVTAGTSGLIRNYRFDEGTGSTTSDDAGNGTGILVNNPTWASTSPAGATYLWNPGGATTQNITVNASGSYTVQVTNTSGCSVTSDPTVVTVNPVPTISGVTGTQTLCAGNATTLTASSAATSPVFKWYTAATNGTLLFTGATYNTGTLNTSATYYVDVTNSSGCTSTTRTAVTVTVNAVPSVSIAKSDVSCQGSNDGTITVTASGATGPFQYSKDGGTNYQSSNAFTSLAPGSYSVIAKTTNCAATAVPVTIATINDVTPPVPNVASLPAINGECTVTVSTVPTATDNCSGLITATTTDPLTYSAQGNYTITWKYTDAKGNVSTQTQNVVVKDVTPPVIVCAADQTVTVAAGQCNATIVVTSPTVTDNCSGYSGNNGLDFDGQNDWVDIGNQLTANSSYTKEAWIYTKSANASGNIVSADDYPFWLENNLLSASHGFNTGGAGTIRDANQFPVKQWTHVAVTYDAPTHTMKIYKNGIVVASKTNQLSYTASALSIGQYKGSNFINAIIDEVRVWNVARTSAEINANMNIAMTGSPAGLVSRYSFDQGTAGGTNTGITTLTNTQGTTAYNGTLTNFALSGANSNWVSGAPALSGLVLNNSFNNTSNASGTYQIGTTNVVWTATDAAGNVSTCTQVITVNAPEINIAGNSVSIVSGDATPSTTDNTDFGGTLPGAPITKTFTIQNTGTSSLSVSSIGVSGTNASNFTVNGISFPATIAAGGSATFNVTFSATVVGPKTATITVNNTDCDEAAYSFAITAQITCTIPVFTNTNPSVTANTAANSCNAVVSYGLNATGTPTPSLSYNFSGATTGSGSGTGSGQTFNTGVTNVTVAATNSCGTTTYPFIVTVTDNIAPTITAPANVTVINDAGVCGATVTAGTPVTADNCGVASVVGVRSDALALTALYPIGVTTITWTVTDNNGLTATATQTVTVNAPEINMTGNSVSIVKGDVTPSASDNTDMGSTITGTPVNKTFTIQNTGTSSLTVSSINVSGTNAADFTISGISFPATIAASGTANFTVSFNSATAGIKNATITVNNTDCNEASYDFAVKGQTTCIAPSFANTNLYIQQSASTTGCTAVVSYPLSVSGTPAPGVTYSFTGATTGTGNGTGSGQTFNQGITHVTVSATNACGTQTNSFDITVVDDVKPTVISKNITIYLDQTGHATFNAADLDGGSYDNCGAVTIGLNQGTICGTAAEGSSVTLQAPTGVTISGIQFASYGTPNGNCGNFTIGGCNASNSMSIVSALAIGKNSVTIPATNGQFGDPCGGTVKRLYIQASYGYGGTGNTGDFTCANLGANTVTYLVSDAAGNVSTGTAIVTVVDRQGPTITAPNITRTATNPAQCGTNVSFAVTATDCTPGTITYAYSKASGSFFNIGTTPVTVTATDPLGNTSTTTFNVTVVDGAGPVITAPADITINNAAGICGSTTTFAATATDCTGLNSISYDKQPGSYVFPVGTSTVTITARDVLGNQSTATFHVTVNDNELPVITAPANISVNNDPGKCGAALNIAAPAATDNCGIASKVGVRSDALALTAQYPVGTTTITWTVTDTHNNISTATQTVTVTDNEKPVPVITQLPTVTGECSASVSVPAATDNCSGMITATTNDPLSYTAQGTYTITWTYTDSHNNSTTQTQTVIVKDVTAPVPDIATLPTISGECSASVTAPKATDNCSGTITGTTNDPLSYTTQGTYTITWTFDDGNGNTSTQTQTVIVKDVTPAVITTPAPIVVNNDADKCGATVQVPALIAADNCGVVSIVGLRNDGLALTADYPVGMTTINWTVTDKGGNISSAIQTVLVMDNQKPVLIGVPANATVECNAVPAPAVVTATDNCSTSAVNFAETRTDGNCPGRYTLTRTWSVTDPSNNTTTAVQVIIVQDTQAPVLSTAPANVTVECNAVPAAAVLTAIDNCDGAPVVTYQEVRTNGNCPGNYTLTRTWTATDACGNTSSKTQVITVQDTQAPVLSAAPANVTVECNAVPAAAVLTAVDNCDDAPVVTYQEVRTNGNCPSNYTLTRTWTATDACGNTSSKTQVITVQDTQAPVLSAAPANVTVECNAVPAAAVLTATDNCDGAPVVTYQEVRTNGNCPSNYTLTRTWTATDACGNTSSKTQVITVQDTQAPVLSVAPANVTVECNAVPAAAVLTAVDNCDGAPVVIYQEVRTNGNCPSNYTLTRTWTATDACGNTSSKTQVITVQDTQAPVLSAAPANVTVECNAVPAAAVLTAVDNCDGAPVVTYQEVRTNGNCPSNYTLTRTWTATDACGNTSTKTQVITVQDTQAPVLSAAPANATVECDAVPAAAVLTATDNCDTPVVVYNQTRTNGTSPNGYTLTRTWTATDACGNTSSKTQVITVRDTRKPVLSAAPANVTVECNAVPAAAILTATDNCDGAPVVTYKEVRTDGNCPNNYILTRTWTATDASGNSCSKTQVITVQDTQAPVLSAAPANVTVECNAVPTAAVLTATDNCSTPVVTYTEVRTNGNCPGNYTLTRTWTATDACGNSSSKTQVITVQDTQAPVLSAAPANVTVECSAVPAAAVLTATDNCSTPNVVYTQTSTQNTNPNSAGYYNYTITRKWTATDACGNSSSKTQVITVQDTQQPIVVCPVVPATCDNLSGNNKTVTLTASDNCGPVTITYTLSGATVVNGGTGGTVTQNFNIGTTQINWTVKDATGNTSTCITTVVINALPVASITAAGADAFCSSFVLTGNSTLSGPFTYQWLYNNQATCSTQQLTLGLTNPDGVYTLYTTDKNGCRSAVGATYNYQKQNLVSSYTILTYKDASIGKYNKVLSGSIGVMTTKGDADFKSYSVVNGAGSFVKAPDIDKNGTGIVINNQIIGLAAPTLPAMQYNTTSTKYLPDYTVAQYATVTLNGNYDKLTVRRGANVTVTGSIFGTIDLEYGASIRFTSADLNIGDLLVDDGAKESYYSYVRFAPNSSVKISDKVSIGSQVRLNPENNKVTIYMGDLKSDEEKFTVKGGDTRVIANVIMPNGKLRVTATDSDDDDHNACDHKAHSSWLCTHKNHGHYTCNHAAHNASDCNDDVYMTGLFIVESLDSKGNTVIWNNYDCGSSAGTIVVNTAKPAAQTTNATSETASKTEVAVTEEDLKVTVMPNPSTTYFTVKLESKYETPVNMRVMDGRGRVVDAKSKIGANSTIQIGHNYSSGTYYAELIQGTTRKVVQLIKARG